MMVMASFQIVLTNHITRYPRMQLADVYKLAHQACLGSEHAVLDLAGARHWLEGEVARLAAGPEEPVLDPISADGRILRVHLRPFLARGGNLEQLLESFVRTAHEYRGSASQLRSCGSGAEALAGTWKLPITREEVRAYWGQMEAQGYPAVHHSATYEAAYRPAYRVVAREFLAGL